MSGELVQRAANCSRLDPGIPGIKILPGPLNHVATFECRPGAVWGGRVLAWVPDCFQGTHIGQFLGARANSLAWVPDCFQGTHTPVRRLRGQQPSLGTRLFPGHTCRPVPRRQSQQLAWVPDCFQGIHKPVRRLRGQQPSLGNQTVSGTVHRLVSQLQVQHASLSARLFPGSTEASSSASGPT
ncbi:hypothetical protein Bbelb_168870 [Branchiostoma belcheri]|nr:hypothetical protein Bbelb_168870 [Branchiostoma belcheri]